MQRREFFELLKVLGVGVAVSPIIAACKTSRDAGFVLSEGGVYQPRRVALQSEIVDGKKFYLFRDIAIANYSSPYVGNETNFAKRGQEVIRNTLSVYDIIEGRDLQIPFGIGGSHTHDVLIGAAQFEQLKMGKGVFARTTETLGHFHVVYLDPELVTDANARPIYVEALG